MWKNRRYVSFWFSYKNYSRARNNSFYQLFMLDLVNTATSLVLCGHGNLPLQIKNFIFASVHKLNIDSSNLSLFNVHISIYLNSMCITIMVTFKEEIEFTRPFL